MNYRYIDPCLDTVKPSERWSKLYDRKFPSVDWKNLEIDKGERRSKPNNTEMECVDWKSLKSKPRQRWSQLYNRKSKFMEWISPDQSVLVDKTSQVPLSHITLLCKLMLCGQCKCSTCNHVTSDSEVYRSVSIVKEDDTCFQPCGSFAEDCPLPLFLSV